VGYSLSDDSVSDARAGWLKRQGVLDVRGDVRDLGSLLATVRDYRPDLLVHLAAQPILSRGFTEPHLTFDVNINGSLSVLETVRVGAVPALIHVTSDKCYAPTGANALPITESSPLGGSGPYPASKSMAETLFNEFSRLMPADAAVASVRLGNVIGGGDEADRLVPNALRSFKSGQRFSMRDPAAKRPFQHVLDVVFGMSKLAAGILSRQVMSGIALNFAPPATGCSVGEVVAELARAWGPEALVGEAPEPADFPEQQIIQLDGSMAARLLGWEHHLNLSDAASWTVTWAKIADAELSPADATHRQVHEFLDLILARRASVPRNGSAPAGDPRAYGPAPRVR
jgi:CDP-glucose 4,6-dehydratase